MEYLEIYYGITTSEYEWYHEIVNSLIKTNVKNLLSDAEVEEITLENSA